MAKNCLMCGKPSGMYALCFSCIKLKKEGKIEKCTDCGKWHYVGKECSCKQNNEVKQTQNKESKEVKNKEVNSSAKCVICGNDSPYGKQCKECFYEMKEHMEEFDKNAKPHELKDHYYNLKSGIYRMVNFKTVQKNSNRLIALAVLLEKLYDDTSLIDRVFDDVEDIIEKKKPKQQKISSYSEKQDSQKETILRTLDGHIVKSRGEVEVDDVLYNLRVVHCYEKKVSEINLSQRAVFCDWFIPIRSNSQGIYIEYWGMRTKEYLKNKEEKKKLYRDFDIPYIGIEKDDINDKQGLEVRLKMEINSIAEKEFNIIKFIK